MAQILVVLWGKLPNKQPVGSKHLKIIWHQISSNNYKFSASTIPNIWSWHQISFQICARSGHQISCQYLPGPGRSAASCAPKTPTVSIGLFSASPCSASSNPAVTVVTVESVTTRARYQGRRAVWQNKMLLLNKMLRQWPRLVGGNNHLSFLLDHSW